MESDENTRDIRIRNDRPSLWFYIPFVLAAVLLGILFVTMRDGGNPLSDATRLAGSIRQVSSGLGATRREVFLYFPRADSDWVSQPTEIKGGESIRHEIRQCLELLLKGSPQLGVQLFGGSLLIDEIYIDSNRNVVIDFQTADQTVMNLGGIQRENLAIQSIIRTLAVNFPDLQTVRFLFNHKETLTFAGHISNDRSFEIRPRQPENTVIPEMTQEAPDAD